MFENLLKLANSKKFKVYLLGASPEVNKAALAKITELYPSVNAKGSGDIKVNKEGYSELEIDRKRHIEIIRDIDSFKPDILFVALGAPKQEKWVSNNLEKINVGGAMVVGGALDYFVGKMRKPPPVLSRLGLEWLWRAILEPHRLKRIFTAVVVFPVLVFKSKFTNTYS